MRRRGSWGRRAYSPNEPEQIHEPPELKPFFAQIDTNGDGAIDVEEAQVMANNANGQQAEPSRPSAEYG